MLSLIVGIASSLIATGLFIGASELLRRVALPWYADKVYRGARIDGTWELESLNEVKVGKEDSSTGFVLTQRGDVISGIYSHSSETEGKESYRVSGSIRDGYFLFTMVPISDRQLDGGASMLFIYNKNDKLLMSGFILCRDNDHGESAKVTCTELLTFRWSRS